MAALARNQGDAEGLSGFAKGFTPVELTVGFCIWSSPRVSERYTHYVPRPCFHYA